MERVEKGHEYGDDSQNPGQAGYPAMEMPRKLHEIHGDDWVGKVLQAD